MEQIISYVKNYFKASMPQKEGCPGPSGADTEDTTVQEVDTTEHGVHENGGDTDLTADQVTSYQQRGYLKESEAVEGEFEDGMGTDVDRDPVFVDHDKRIEIEVEGE